MKYKSQKGFTLVEMLIVVAISGIVGSAIIGFFIAQQRSHTSQEQVTYMQQNIRAGLGIMLRELRMAGYDPDRDGLAAFSDPALNQITIQMYDSAGTLVTTPFTHFVDAANNQYDLRRNNQAMAEGIEDVAFAFAYDADGTDIDGDTFLDGDGQLDTDADGVIYAIAAQTGAGPFRGLAPNDPAGTANWWKVDPDTGVVSDTGTRAFAANIRAVKIWILARTDARDPNYRDTRNHYDELAWPRWNADGKDAFNDNRRRRGIVTIVLCRNMGL
jgi:type IV pilus assembly protein PilW